MKNKKQKKNRVQTNKKRIQINLKLGYLKDSNAAAHSVDTGIS